jgi:hypothetical protein
MILQQVLLEANSLDLIVDEYEVTGNRGERQRLLERGLRVAIRGMEVLINEPFVQNPQRYVEEINQRFNSNSAAVAEELRHDAASLRLFLSAEVRLLSDLGLPPHAVARTRSAIAEAITEGRRNPETIAARMAALISELTEDLNRLEDDARHRGIWRRLTGVLVVLCGAPRHRRRRARRCSGGSSHGGRVSRRGSSIDRHRDRGHQSRSGPSP